MAISFRGAATASIEANEIGLNEISVSAEVQAGDVLLAQFASQVAQSPPPGWQQLGSTLLIAGSGGQARRFGAYRAKATASGVYTYTFRQAFQANRGGRIALGLSVWSGADPDAVLVAGLGDEGQPVDATTIEAPALTTLRPHAMVLRALSSLPPSAVAHQVMAAGGLTNFYSIPTSGVVGVRSMGLAGALQAAAGAAGASTGSIVDGEGDPLAGASRLAYTIALQPPLPVIPENMARIRRLADLSGSLATAPVYRKQRASSDIFGVNVADIIAAGEVINDPAVKVLLRNASGNWADVTTAFLEAGSVKINSTALHFTLKAAVAGNQQEPEYLVLVEFDGDVGNGIERHVAIPIRLLMDRRGYPTA